MPTQSVRLIMFCLGSLLFASAAVGEGKYQQTRDDKTIVWNSDPKPGDEANWNGRRDEDGYAKGFGTLTWYKRESTVYARYFGNMVHGKLNGAVNVHSQGKTAHALFADGKRVSRWTMGTASWRDATAKQSQTDAQPIAKTEKKKPPRDESAVAEVKRPTSNPPKNGGQKAEENAQRSTLNTQHSMPDVPAEGPVVAKTEMESIDSIGPKPGEVQAPSTPPKSVADTQTGNNSRITNPIAQAPKPDAVADRHVTEARPAAEKPVSKPVPAKKLPPGADDSLRSLVRPPSALRATPDGDASSDSSQSESASAPNSYARPTKEEAIQVADSAIRIAGYNLSAYHRSRAEYNAAADAWFLIYDRTPAEGESPSAEELSVAVDGTTRQATIVPGK